MRSLYGKFIAITVAIMMMSGSDRISRGQYILSSATERAER